MKRAHILLKADVGGPGWTDAKIADAYDCRTKTVENVRQRFVEQGFEIALNGQKREKPPTEKLLDGEQEAKVIAMRLGQPPAGYGKWTLRLLARKVVELKIAEAVSYQTVRRTLKKRDETKVDGAIEMANLLEGRYAACEKVLVVCDNLNTHTPGAFYEVFEPERARSLVRRIEFHYTPKHGSWLNIAENELSSMTRQCVAGRRMGSVDQLRQETTAWHEDVNRTQRGVDWQMKIDDARTKLKSVYPKIKM